MTRLGRRRAAVVVALALVAAALLGGAWAVDAATDPVVVVEDEGGEELLSVPVEENATVVLAYTHSVEKTPVRDVYAVRDGGLTMTRTEFSSYGAGLPSTAPVERTGDGSYVYRPPDRRYETVRVATGRVAGHELVVDGERYDLVGLADGGTVRLRVTTRLHYHV